MGFGPFAGLIRLPRVRSCFHARAPTCRFHRGLVTGSGVRFFCPVITCLPQEELLSLAMCGFWGLAPSTSRAITVAGPAIALKRAARPCRPILPWVLFPLAGHQARFPQSLGAAGFVPRVRGNRSDTSVSLAPTAPGQWFPGRHFWRPSALALFVPATATSNAERCVAQVVRFSVLESHHAWPTASMLFSPRPTCLRFRRLLGKPADRPAPCGPFFFGCASFSVRCHRKK